MQGATMSDLNGDMDLLSSAGSSTVGMLLCFGSILFTSSAMAARTWLLGDNRAIFAAIRFSTHRKDDISPIENSFISLFVLFYYTSLFGLVLLVTYILEHHPPFPHDDRTSFDPDYLVFLVLLLIVGSIATVERNERKRKPGLGLGGSSSNNYGSPYDDGSTTASGLPSIATRKSFRSQASSRSGRSSRSGKSDNSSSIGSAAPDEGDWQQQAGGRQVGGAGAAAGGSSSHGSVEDIDLHDSKNAQLDTLEEESVVPKEEDSSTNSGLPMEDVSLGGEDPQHHQNQNQNQPTHVDNKTRASNNRKKAATSTVAPGGRAANGKDRSPSGMVGLLNVHQTLEIKGFLSACYLLYQLTDAETISGDTNLFYNISMVGASCFVFLSGFGHAMYFYCRNHYRPTRIMKVLFRLNMSAFFLCLLMGQPYIFYYVCPLHTMAFLLTFGIMKTQRMLNYTKFGLRIKLLALAGIFFVVWDFNAGLFDLLFTVFFPQGPPSIGLANGPLYEWYYHTHLHHWAVFVGIVYAINYPITSLLMDKTELLADTQATLAKGTVCISLIVALSLWLSGPFTTPKFAFDSTHPYFAFLPILSYVYFRNVTQWMRQHHLGIFKSLGSFSLEIYLFHKHIFMANDGTQMLVLVPGYPKCNVVATGILLLVVARTVHKMTVIVGGMILPSDNEGKCIRAFITIGVCGTAFYCLALLLEYMEMKSATVILITIMIIGFIVYQTILDLTWNEYRNVDRQGINDEEETPVAKASPPIIGAMVIFVLGISWHIIAMAGAAGGQGALPVLCESFVNEGIWAPVSSCSEYQRGLDTREYHVAGYYRACDSSETMHWGWRKTRPNTRCRFRSRTVSDLQKKLAYRRIVFVGDLTVRNIFHAFCRSLGDPEAGRYDATIADHADISKQIGIVKLEYKWAPLAFDQVNKLKNLRSKGQKGGADLLIVGGGTLDRLHVWATDEDQESHKAAVQKLVKELDYATAPTVWCTPTTVNTPALLNDEKRNQMNEMAISEVRKMYQDLDVETTANFVLEGPAYSRGRVSESYDGMMYPHSVYDAGVQIIANALDWLIVPSADGEEDGEEPFHPPTVGQLSNPFLGLMMTCFSLIGLFFFDGYFGFSYLSSLFVRGDGLKSTKRRQMQNFMPNDLYDDAFVPFHQRLKLPLSKSDASSYRAKQQLTQSGRGRVQDIHLPQLAHDSDVLSLLDNDSLLGGGDRGSSRRGLGMMTRRK